MQNFTAGGKQTNEEELSNLVAPLIKDEGKFYLRTEKVSHLHPTARLHLISVEGIVCPFN